jgi:hypothetical protein
MEMEWWVLTSAVLQTHVDHLGEGAGRLDTKDDMNLSEGVVGLLNCCCWLFHQL